MLQTIDQTQENQEFAEEIRDEFIGTTIDIGSKHGRCVITDVYYTAHDYGLVVKSESDETHRIRYG